MRRTKKITDRYGNSLRKGCAVKLIDIPLDLFLGRTEPEQNILRAGIGNNHFIQSIDRHGKLELEFYDKYNIPYTILINASCVKRL
jgi:hypothetical protein